MCLLFFIYLFLLNGFILWLVGRLVGRSVVRSVGWLVGWLVGSLVLWLVGWLVVGWLVVGWLVGWLDWVPRLDLVKWWNLPCVSADIPVAIFLNCLKVSLENVNWIEMVWIVSSSSSCSWRVRCVFCSLILKMKSVLPFLPRSSYVPSCFWLILWCLFCYSICVHPLYTL